MTLECHLLSPFLAEPIEANMLFSARAREFAKRFHNFVYLNPLYHPQGEQVAKELASFSLGAEEENIRQPEMPAGTRPLLLRVIPRAEHLLESLKQKLVQGKSSATAEEINWYLDLLVGCSYFRHFEGDQPLHEAQTGTQRVPAFRRFQDYCERFTQLPLDLGPFINDPAHMFAIYFQTRRSVGLIRNLIQGNSLPARKLRASVWNSIFPHQLRLYGVLLFNRMHEISTLILGPSGTGKELVATAIGESRFVPFDSKRERFVEPLPGAFHPVNLSAMPAELIESEMFGHAAGAFTGATRNRIGWFETCSTGHTVFLDEIGELAEAVQVKLLRVLQNREFYRVGETEPRHFHGRVIAATNRDLNHEIEAGKFRQDLLFRLCSDVIRTPSLREQLDDTPDDLSFLVHLSAKKCLGAQATTEQIEWLTDLSVRWIEESPKLGCDYPWPGNFRELEQCVRSVMVRGTYEPMFVSAAHRTSTAALPGQSATALDKFLVQVKGGELTIDALLDNYCSYIFSRSANLTQAAHTLDKHRVTVQARIKPELVDAFQRERSN